MLKVYLLQDSDKGPRKGTGPVQVRIADVRGLAEHLLILDIRSALEHRLDRAISLRYSSGAECRAF